MLAALGFLVGFVTAGLLWVATDLPFPISTRVPIGVVLVLAAPYAITLEVAGYVIDAGNRFSSTRLGMIGVCFGAAALATELATFWVLSSSDWACFAVWLASPIIGAAGLILAAGRQRAGQVARTQ